MSNTPTIAPPPGTPERHEWNEELKAIGFDPRNPAHRIAVRLAERYGLDPLAHELIVIPRKGAYITRDGLLTLAHRSGVLDGIVVESESDTDTHWCAEVSVYRTDMSHPFTYRGRYPHNGDNAKYGPEMAVKCAEVMALRRAFRVTGLATREEAWDVDEVPASAPYDDDDDGS